MHTDHTRPGGPSGQLSAQSARRLAAATKRIHQAKRLGPKATVEAVRACLLAAVKVNPSRTITDEVADHALIKLRELYQDADRSWAQS